MKMSAAFIWAKNLACRDRHSLPGFLQGFDYTGLGTTPTDKRAIPAHEPNPPQTRPPHLDMMWLDTSGVTTGLVYGFDLAHDRLNHLICTLVGMNTNQRNIAPKPGPLYFLSFDMIFCRKVIGAFKKAS